jgi:hypothetical protein
MLLPGPSRESSNAPTDRTAITEIPAIRAKETTMILATTTVEDVDRFLKVFSTKGADKRALQGSKGADENLLTRPEIGPGLLLDLVLVR